MIWLVTAAIAGPCTVTATGGRIRASERAIGFVTAKAELDAASLPAIDDVACVLTADTSLPLVIGVHTDSQGSESFARRLSQARADAIREALIARGIDGTRVTAVGYGESRPIADNATPEGRAQNRRIELLTTRSADTPPAPAPAPAPVAEAPRQDPCPAWRAAGSASPPSWEGCASAAGLWACHLPMELVVAAALARSCLGEEAVQRDGATWFVRLTDGKVAELTADDGGSSLVLQ